MTLPVIPGPFSGLEQAGRVIGESLAAKRVMGIQDEERARAALATLGQLGILTPDALAGDNFAQLFGAAGIPQPTAQQVKPDVEGEKGRRLLQLLAKTEPDSFMGRMLLGVPTEAMENEDALKAHIAQFVTSEMKASPAVARAVAKTPEAKIAEKAEQVQLGALGAEELDNKVKSNIRTSIISRLGKDKQFSKLADYAAVGALPYLLQVIESSRIGLTLRKQEGMERLKVAAQQTQIAANEYKDRVKKWNEERAKLVVPFNMQLSVPGYANMNDEEKAAAEQAVLATHDKANPEPDYQSVLNEYLDSQGVSPAEYKKNMRELMGLAEQVDAEQAPGVTGGSSSTAASGINMQNVSTVVQAIKDGRTTKDGKKITIEIIEASQLLNDEEKAKVKEILAGKKP